MTQGSDDGVSVVIPTFNRAAYIGDAISSVRDQVSAPPIQIIVVDDASTDSTPSVLAGFGTDIEVERVETSIERGAARNRGAARARYPVLAFLDSDDRWELHKIARQLPVGRSTPSVTGVRFVDSSGRQLRSYVPPPDASNRLMFENPYLAAPSTLMLPTAAFGAVGGFPEDRELQGSEDWLFLAKLAAAGHELAVVAEALTAYRVHGDNFTSDVDRVARCMWAATEWLEANGVVTGVGIGRLRGHTAGVIGRQYAARSRFREATRWGRLAVRTGTPRSAGEALLGIAVSGGGGVLRRVRRR